MAWLDRLLLPDPETGRTIMNWLRREATSHSAPQMVETLKESHLSSRCGRRRGVLGAQPQPGQVARPTRVESPDASAPTHGAPAPLSHCLAAFIHQALQHHIDIAIELYDQCLWEYHGAAKQELIEFRKAIARSTNEKLLFLRTLGQVLLDPEIKDATVRTESFARVPEEVLRAAVSETEGLMRPRHDDAIDFFGKRYNHHPAVCAGVLQSLTFHAQGPHNPVLPAVDVIRTLDRAATRHPVPRCADGTHHGGVAAVHSRVGWEYQPAILRTLYVVAPAECFTLRNGRTQSALYQPRLVSHPASGVAQQTARVIRQTGTPQHGRARLEEREAELETAMAQVECLLARQDSHLRVEDNRLVYRLWKPTPGRPRPSGP